MCSVQDSEEGDDSHPVPQKKAFSAGQFSKCMKCGEDAVSIARTKDPFCKNCFNVYFTHRFRSILGKSRIISPREKVLLAFSGGLSSRVLLALVEEGLSDRVRKKLNFTPSVIYIDEGAILNQELTERCQAASNVLNIASKSGFPAYFTQLEQVFGSCEAYTIHQLLSVTSGTNKQLNTQNSEASKVETSQGGASMSITTSTCTTDERPSTGNMADGSDLFQVQPKSSSSFEPSCEDAVLTPVKPLTDEDEGDFCHKLMTFISKNVDPSLEPQLVELFKNTKSLTANESLLLSLRLGDFENITSLSSFSYNLSRHQLLTNIARKYGFTKVMVGDNATRLAVRLLGNIAQGKGSTLPLDTGFVDERCSDVVFVRPLREFPNREVATHIVLNNLSTVTFPNLATMTPEKASIEKLTESFINGLQADFPSTTNTIFRTGDKLTVSSTEGQNETSFCCLCQAPLGEIDDKSVFTHLNLSEIRAPSIARDTWEGLCYGCRLTVKDMKQGTRCLPPFVLTASQTDTQDSGMPSQSIRESMKAQIQGFLLHDVDP